MTGGADVLAVTLKDGTVHEGRADYPRGSPEDPMTYVDVAEKFRGCAIAACWPMARAERLIEPGAGLEELDRVRQLTAVLTG